VNRLVLNGMKLQPCRPSFFQARDAIIQADMVLTGGENFCELWEAFAERGLGPDASVDLRTPWGGGVRTDVGFFWMLGEGVFLLTFVWE
jgi:extracellular elastinolytic metalloproteinase